MEIAAIRAMAVPGDVELSDDARDNGADALHGEQAAGVQP